MKKLCKDCKFRSAYDNNKNSLLGKFWRWHINFCPGWKKYYNSLPLIEKDNLRNNYKLKK